MEQSELANKREKQTKKWLNGEEEDIAMVEYVAWSFLPAAKDVMINDNKLVYVN